MKFLVDANVLSEPTRPRPDPKVVTRNVTDFRKAQVKVLDQLGKRA